jgi:hypothetical protein
LYPRLSATGKNKQPYAIPSVRTPVGHASPAGFAFPSCSGMVANLRLVALHKSRAASLSPAHAALCRDRRHWLPSRSHSPRTLRPRQGPPPCTSQPRARKYGAGSRSHGSDQADSPRMSNGAGSIVEIELAEPAVSKVQRHFLAPIAVTDQEHPNHQLSIHRGRPGKMWMLLTTDATAEPWQQH